MADGIYMAMSGAVARSEQLNAVADNLANAQTPGFKGAQPAFESFLLHPAAVATGVDLRPGAVTATQDPLHVLPDEGAFLAVAAPSGEVAYTRDGRLSVKDGHLWSAGRRVLDDRGLPLSIPENAKVLIADDGEVRADGQPLGKLGLFALAGPQERVGASVYAPRAGGAAEPVGVRVRQGVLEGSNASPLEAALHLVSAQRHFDTSMQAIQTYRRLDERIIEAGKVR